MKTFWLALFVVSASWAQMPSISNARVETRAVSGDPLHDLHHFISSEAGPAWFGYAVESNRREGNSCCWNNEHAGCFLEGGKGRGDRIGGDVTVKLEGSTTVFVLFRVQDHKIGKIHPVSGGCPLDAGGLRFVWLTGVTQQASLALLSEQVKDSSARRDVDAALASIAMHAGEGADVVLQRFAGPSEGEWLREKALFWLASSRGARGFAALKHAAETDGSAALREKMMFDFSISKEPGAIEELIRFARNDVSSGVRGQALFWLAQKAGVKASSAITNAIENDPDTEVKKKAVFALQQLPKDEGVPLLISVARTNRNAEVRKQAIFWLGQSGDARALAFIQEVLLGKM